MLQKIFQILTVNRNVGHAAERQRKKSSGTRDGQDPASLADTDAVSRLLGASYSTLLQEHYSPDVLQVALPAITTSQPALLGSGRFFVAERMGEIVACGGWSPEEPGGGAGRPGQAHLRHFATHPDHLRGGLARRIVEACAKQASEQEKTSWFVFASLASVSFYAAIGLRSVERIAVPIAGVPVPVVAMEGPIRTAAISHENARPSRA